jgi:hypothetical protein
MSDTVPMTLKLPPERRLLIALLSGLEGVLLLVPIILGYIVQPQPNPGGPYCPAPVGGPLPPGYPCPPTQQSSQIASLIALACTALAVLVLPAVIGWLSIRWQTALAAPAIPVWVLLLVSVTLALINDYSSPNASLASAGLSGLFSTIESITIVGSLILQLIAVVGLGGVAWLARRAFAR